MSLGAEKRSEAREEQDDGSQSLRRLWLAVAGNGAFPEGSGEELPVTPGEKMP